ncbi:MAG: MBOAT family O-acyltransferase, partial [Holophaga sp.]|nr:MBOAT family O-acyltransferase [Holophaga sp.]
QVELRRGQVAPKQPYLNFLLYIFFFPHHQAGPIMRPHAFLICFSEPRTFFRSRMVTGLMIFIWGLFKKVWIADMVAPMVNKEFSRFELFAGSRGNLLLMGVLYGIQIYGDFSGYSDIAVGLGRMFGYKFDRNFHQPYLASNPSEFWKRWHITLTNWMRDFVYLPLWNWGAGRFGTRFRPITIMLASSMALMLVMGLWHGAGWNFILWGGVHGALFVGWRMLPGKLAPGLLASFAFQTMVMAAWVIFREPNLDFLAKALSRYSSWLGMDSMRAFLWLAGIMAFSRLEDLIEQRFKGMARWACRNPLPVIGFTYGVILFLVLIGAGSATTFIYQRF